MPLKSFSFNGIRKPWIYMLAGRQKAPFAPVQWNTLTIPGRPGVVLQSKQTLPIVISQPIGFLVDDDLDALAKKDELAAWLLTDEPVPLEFDDEPGRVYYAVVQNTIEDFEIFAKTRKGTIQFLVPEGYGYGPLRTQTINVPPASFSRNSVAYLSDGTQVSANQPRFEQGGILIEEGTTNLIPSALAKNLTSEWTSGNLNGTYTLSVRGGTGQVNISGGHTGSVAVGQTLTFNVSNATITLTPANGTPQFVQLEQKPYATSFVDGTRQPETLTLMTDGVLNPDEGTIEMELEVPYVGNYNSFFYMNTSNGRFLLYFYVNGAVRFDYGAIGSGLASTNGAVRANTKMMIAIRWSKSQNTIALFVNGTKYEKALPNGVADRFPDKVSVVNSYSAKLYNLRVSRIARSDAEILDAYQNGFTVDEYTTAYLPFDGDLNVQTPNIVVNEGTAETYPTFTAYVKQPITFLDIISPDSYMRVGQPYEVSQTPVDGDKPVLQDEMTTTTGWGAATSVVDGVVQGTMVSDGNRFVVQSYGPPFNGWGGPALKKSLPNPVQDFRVHALVDFKSSAKGTGRIEIYGLDVANNIVFRMTIHDFWKNSVNGRAFWEIGPNTDLIFSTYGKKSGALSDYYGSLAIERKGNRWKVYTARRTGPTNKPGVYVDYVEKTFIDTKNQYNSQLAQIMVHIGKHMTTDPIAEMSINHVFVYDLYRPSTNEIPYIAYPGDILQFDHKNAVVYRNGEPIMSVKDFGARFFPLAPGATEFAVNPSDAAIVEVEYRPRYK